MHKTNPETHQACRSLLQKAVRRGNIALTAKVARHLYRNGDTSWLKSRAFVILFEECWPLGSELGTPQSSLRNIETVYEMFKRTAQAVKNKDAAGLGSLAYALSIGKPSVLSDVTRYETETIRHVCDAIEKPQDFWKGIDERCSSDIQQALVNSAQNGYRKAGWPWDKAFTLAAAYLAVTTDKLDVPLISQKHADLPLWVALDKHTAEGKVALSNAAKKVGISARQIAWVSFYFESALLNEASNSRWWVNERQWRLRLVGLDDDKAGRIWEKARPIVEEELRKQAEKLEQHLDDLVQHEPQNNPSLPGF